MHLKILHFSATLLKKNVGDFVGTLTYRKVTEFSRAYLDVLFTW